MGCGFSIPGLPVLDLGLPEIGLPVLPKLPPLPPLPYAGAPAGASLLPPLPASFAFGLPVVPRLPPLPPLPYAGAPLGAGLLPPIALPIPDVGVPTFSLPKLIVLPPCPNP